jgi:hypothetical protein
MIKKGRSHLAEANSGEVKLDIAENAVTVLGTSRILVDLFWIRGNFEQGIVRITPLDGIKIRDAYWYEEVKESTGKS